MSKIKSWINTRKAWFLKLSWRKKAAVIIVGLVVLGVIFSVLRPKQPQYITTKVVRSNIIEVVTETGNISTNGRIDVYSPTNGVIETVSVKNGENVKSGQELFTVKSSATEQEKATALAALLQAQATYGAAQATMYSLQSTMYSAWNTYYNLATNSTYQNSDGSPNVPNRALTQFTTAQTTWQAGEASYKNQQAVVNQAGAALANAKLAYDATQNATVKAQVDGVVSNLSVEPGNTVSAKTATTIPNPVLTLANFTNTEVTVLLGEADIAKVKENQPASILVGSVPDKTYKGVVKRVDSIATDVQGVMKYAVYIEILNPDNNLRPGMTADVTITTKEIKNVLSVPNSAVKPYQGGRAVRIPGQNNQIKYVPVTIGIRGEANTQILKGLNEDQVVITSLSNETLKRPGLFGN